MSQGRSVVAVVQAAPVAFDQVRSLEKVRALTAEAAQGGAKLVLFPEAFIAGYPRGDDFGSLVGGRSEAGREAYRRYWASAIDVPGDAVATLSSIAAENAIHLVIGVIEREGGTLYCCVLFFGPDGQLLGKHRKLTPTGSERLIWGSGDGSTMPVIKTPIGLVGSVVCWENYMPLLRTAMYAKGIQIWCAPTADMRDTWLASMRHIAIEGRCFVLSCNQFARRSDFPADHNYTLGNDPELVVSSGGSCIIDPFGKILAGPDYSEETVLFAEIDLDQIPRGKFDLDTVGHYARPDIFNLQVDDRPKSPVQFRSEADA